MSYAATLTRIDRRARDSGTSAAGYTGVSAISVIIISLPRSHTLGKAIGLIRRRGLVARRRLGQRSARRLARKLRLFVLFLAEHRVVKISLISELGRRQLAAEAGCRRLIAVV